MMFSPINHFKVMVLCQKDAELYSSQSHKETSAIISITSMDAADIHIENILVPSGIRAIHRLNFYDSDDPAQCISYSAALKTADFIKNWYPKVDKFIVHCEAGISRSAGVAGAILQYFEHDASPIFDNFYFKPNVQVYRMILNALYYDEQSQ